MNYFEVLFSFSYGFNAVVLLFLSIFVLIKNHRSRTNITYSTYSFAIAWWSFFSLFMIGASNREWATLWDRVCLLGVIFIPTTFFHFTCDFLQLKRANTFVVWAYILSLIFLCLDFTPYFISTTGPVYLLTNFTVAGVGYYAFLLYYTAMVLVGIFLIYRSYSKELNPIRRRQLSYLFWFTVIGYSGGALNFNLVLKIPPYSLIPFGNILIGLYGLGVAYAMIKYQFLDIKVVITRISVFVFVYTLILGIPIWIGFKVLGLGLWLVPITVMAIFSTVGPFIYLYIQNRAENKLLQEQRRYQTTLRQASAGMGRIKDLRKLLNLIVYVVTRTVRLEHARVYIHNNKSNAYILGALKIRRRESAFVSAIAKTSVLVEYLQRTGLPVMYNEIKQDAQDSTKTDALALEPVIRDLGGSLIFPILIETRLLAIIVLGEKESGGLYTEGDLSVFSILANQAALAIENAQFYEEMKKTHEQLYQAEKMATIGTMADGLSHQINNRFHALGFIAGDALDTIKLNKDKPMPEDVKGMVSELERAFARVQENVVQGGEVVQGLLRYTRKGDTGMAAVDFDAAFKSAFEMAQFKIKAQNLKIEKTYAEGIPKIKGNFTQLQEVFFNLIDNAYDAMMQRKTEKKEEGYQPTLTISYLPKGAHVDIIFADNGIGVKPEDLTKLFTPFFTTKLSSKKGTGLGLYVIKKIIEENHQGIVEMDSDYMVGTKMKVRLPLVIE